MIKLSLSGAMETLSITSKDYARLLENRTFDVGLYKPAGTDPQKPHVRDEIYVIASGLGDFTYEGKTEPFGVGDVFFVPAQAEHRFANFSDNFSTWVIFFGAAGGT